jgi:hypothetical protein
VEHAAKGQTEQKSVQPDEPGRRSSGGVEAHSRLSRAQLRAAVTVLDSYVRRSRPQSEPPSA